MVGVWDGQKYQFLFHFIHNPFMVEMLITVLDYMTLIYQVFQSSGVDPHSQVFTTLHTLPKLGNCTLSTILSPQSVSKQKGRMEREKGRKASIRAELDTRSRKWNSKQSVCNWRSTHSFLLHSGERLHAGKISETQGGENTVRS